MTNSKSAVFDDDRLDAAIEAIRQEPIPPAAVDRVTSAARRLQADTSARAPAPRPLPSARFASRWPRLAIPLVAGLATASILAMLVPGMVAQMRATAAFAEVVERAKQTTGVRFSTTQSSGQDIKKGRQWFAGRRGRFEVDASHRDYPLVIIFDNEQGKILALDTFAKAAQVLRFEKTLIGDGDIVEQLANLEKAGVEPVPGEPDTFRGKGLPALGLTSDTPVVVVVDHESRLPTRIVFENRSSEQAAKMVFDDFHWNEPIDEALLSVEPPEGYQTVTGIIGPKETTPPATEAE